MLSLLLLLAAQAAGNQLPPGQALPPPTGEEQAVLNSADALLAAFTTGNPAEILRWVYPEGRVTGTGTLPNRTGIHQESWTQFTHRAAGSGFQETMSDRRSRWMGMPRWSGLRSSCGIGGKVYNCGSDHFDMVREGGPGKTMNL